MFKKNYLEAMLVNFYVKWAPLLYALFLLLLFQLKNVQTVHQQQQPIIKSFLSSSSLLLSSTTITPIATTTSKQQQQSQTQQKHSNAIMGEAGVTNSPMVDNPAMSLAQEYDHDINIRGSTTRTHNMNRYDTPDDCHFATVIPTTTTTAFTFSTPTTLPIIMTTTTITTTPSLLISSSSGLSGGAATTSQDHNNYNGDDDISLTCNLRTINSEFDTTNFSVIPSDHTLSLYVICNNEIMAKSRLESNSFIHLIRMRELSLQYCKFSKLPRNALNGLTHLRNLTIRTHNTVWPSINFDIEMYAFDSLKNLKLLDLSTNNIWTLPNGIFCTLNSLILLNVSANHLQDVNELGFREYDNFLDNLTTTQNTNHLINCNMDLEILDISYNNLVLLPAHGFSALRRSRVLLVHHNEISMLADRALSGLKHLQILDLSSNKIVALPSELFGEQMTSIQEIYLQNNTLSVLSPKLFANLQQLQALDLSRNQIKSTWIDSQTFLGLIRLVSLNLAHNRLTNLSSSMFTDLYTLQVLNLRHNHVEILNPHTFTPMHNLHTLLLSYNKLTYMPNNALNGLYVLSLLSVDNNAIKDIHKEAFVNCSSLQDLNLNGNKLSSVPISLRNMHLLRTVDLGENHISSLEMNSFDGLTNLYGLRLISNKLTNISMTSFKSLHNLQILNLARNSISYVEQGAFEMTKDIQAIRLDGNNMSNINGLFKNMPALLWLNISDNSLDYFDYAQIPLTLQWMDLHNNKIHEIYNSMIFVNNNNIRLQTLDLSFNQLQRINAANIPNSIKLLFLNNNAISIIEPDTFINKINLTRVDLYANHISTLDIKSLRILSVQDNKPLPEFYIGGNPFTCDCNIDWLQKINNIRTRQYPRIMDLQTVYCKLLNNREHSFISLVDARPKHFLCNYKTHCFAVCHCCEFDACDCEMTCPTNCTCLHDQTWSTNIVECSFSAYTEIPRNIPMDTTELYIDGNNFNELIGHSFLGRKNLEILYINGSNVQFIYNTTFSGLKRLMVLHLEDNIIEQLRYQEFESCENVQELYLQNNHIYFIANRTFRALNKLHILHLEGNRLLYFEVWELIHNNPYLQQIGLADNPWSCECAYLMHFRYFLKQCASKILNMSSISCIYNNATSILSEQNGTKCILHEDSAATYMHTPYDIEKLLPILLMASCLFIGFFGIIFALIYYRNYWKDWTFSGNCLWNIIYHTPARLAAVATGTSSTSANKQHLNDAYFAYSLQDDQFVSLILASVLERDIGYRLILHYRDVNLHTFLTDAIFDAVSNSKVFFIVLSKNFLYNEWSRFDYKSTLHELIVKRRVRLTFILYGDLPQRDIDADMRHYLRTSTCIEWDDKKFWSKLRLAMPNLRNKAKHLTSNRNTLNIYAATHHHNHAHQQTLQTGDTLRHMASSNVIGKPNNKRYATINECMVRGEYGTGDSLNSKFNTINHHQPQQQQDKYPPKKHHTATVSRQSQTLNFDVAGHRSTGHDYAVPTYLSSISATSMGCIVPNYDSVDYVARGDYGIDNNNKNNNNIISSSNNNNNHSNMATSFSTNFLQKSMSFNNNNSITTNKKNNNSSRNISKNNDEIHRNGDADNDDHLTDKFNSSNDVTSASNLNLGNTHQVGKISLIDLTNINSSQRAQQHQEKHNNKGNLWA